MCLFEESGNRFKELEGENFRDIGISYVMSARGEQAMNKQKLKCAEALFRESLKMDLKLYRNSIDHINIATTLHKLANVLLKLQNIEEAGSLYEKARGMISTLGGEKSGSYWKLKALLGPE